MPYSPILGVSSAIFKKDEVLIIKREKGPFLGLWSLPGGHIEKSETPEQAALRELHEETNITAKLIQKVDFIDILLDKNKDQQDKHYQLHVFCGAWLSGDAIAKSDASDIRWVTQKELEELELTTGTIGIITKAKKIVDTSHSNC